MMRKSDYRYFSKARQAAKVSDFWKVHVGSIAVYQGNIISVGCNLSKTHPMQKYYNKFREGDGNDHFNPSLHAEINCINSIRHMDIDFSKVKLYVYRIRNDQPYGMARPCPSCMAAIKDIGIKNIYYTTNDGFAYEKVENKEINDVRRMMHVV